MLLSSRKRNKPLLYFVGIVSLLYIVFEVFVGSWKTMPKVNNDNKSLKRMSYLSYNQTFRILYYNPPSWFKTFNFSNCEHSNCVISTDRTVLRDSDGVIFNHANLPSDPPNKNPKQKWIFSCSESPYYGMKTCTTPQWRNKFDWTMSYRHDSDFYFGYGDIVVRKGVIQKDYEEIYKRKKKLVAWIASHCDTQSRRERYVEEMSQIVKVDVFGDCGSLSCEKYHGNDNDSCHDYVTRDYKFYLAFENSLCRDYTTEKFYFLYEYDKPIIPVTLGSFTIANYSHGAVYIDANNFRTPFRLMRRLLALGNNKDAYIDLLRKKDKFRSLTSQQTFEIAMCKICKYLSLQKPGRPNWNIADWFFGEEHCHSPDKTVIPLKKEKINLDEARKYLNKV
ncbi:alpha-(1,3)-fucosyltransferase C-like [Ostrea edulis]|uniref:alpha-(1,3)-fucosyltransferase C-like n=1 Tax=Ostrea edulis TaxID=37623 RepID=UPI0024AEF6B3|nr:alpha-(1,3)-fucosyltransferase C-like [Ostrea edulis]